MSGLTSLYLKNDASLVSHYSFNDATGSTVTDTKGTNNGTWQGTLGSQWVTGKLNDGAGLFNGTDNRVQTTLWSTAIVGLSLSAWFKSDDYTRTEQAIVSNGNGDGAGRGYALILSGNTTTDGSVYFLNHNIAWGAVLFKVQDNNWHHIAYTISADGNTNLGYLDGLLQFTGGNASLATPTGESYIGAQSTAARFFKGRIEEPAFFTRTITSAEVGFLANPSSVNGSPYRHGVVGNGMSRSEAWT